MAGIGFELRRVVNKWSVSSFFQIAMSGAMIVAGPWILSIISITLIRRFFYGLFEGGFGLFMGVIIYCYAFSLLLFGGFHYILTRRMSDLLYLKKENQAFGYVLQAFVPVIIASAALSIPAAVSFDLSLQHPGLFRLSCVLIFTTVNCLWIIMLFVSVLKWYLKIMFVYTGGLGISLLFIYLLAFRYGPSGALLGFGIGHILIVMMLVLLCRIAWKPEKAGRPDEIKDPGRGLLNAVKAFLMYAGKHRYLFGAGVFYYLGIWADKMLFWVVLGERIPGTFIKLFEPYDIPVYLANLTMIPGLIFFVIYSETEFYTGLKKFLNKLSTGRYADLLRVKRRLGTTAMKSLKEQSLLQGVTACLIILLSASPILKITVAAVFFHLLLLTLVNYLFYLERYRHAFISAMIFFFVNLSAAVISLLLLPGRGIPGLSYMLGAAAASAAAGLLLKRDILRLDRYILAKY